MLSTLFLFFIVFVIILAVAVGLGFLLTLFLPFNWFEGTLLSLLSIFVTGVFLRYVLGLLNPDPKFDEQEEEDASIPARRFAAAGGIMTNAGVLHYILANAVFDTLYFDEGPVATMGMMQAQELAVRKAEVAVEILQSKPINARKLTISPSQYRRKMEKRTEHPVVVKR